MDKDEHFKILDALCCFNLHNFFTETDWTEQYSLSNIVKKDEKDSSADNPLLALANEIEESKNNKAEINAMKHYGSVLDDSHCYEKVKKENDERKLENAAKCACMYHLNLDDFYDRKVQLFEKMVTSYSNNRYKSNKLMFLNNPKLEKYCSQQNLFQDACPGLRPSSNWPVSLDDLLAKLSSVQFDEIFHQPFDLAGVFHSDAIAFIRRYFDLLLRKGFNDAQEYQYTEDCLIRALQALLCLKILEGSFSRLYEVLSLILSLWRINSNVMNCIISKVLSMNQDTAGLAFPLKKIVGEMVMHLKENNGHPYPIMRNYSLVDYYSISKNILYAPSKYPFSTASSIATDSKYIYALISGVNGGMLKIGTGYDSTIKGKVYLFEKLLAADNAYQWVYCKNKLYLKSTSSSSMKDFGYLTIINPQNLQTEGQIKLLLPENAKHSLLRKKNENYILLADEYNLHALILEPVLKETKGNLEVNSDDELEISESTAMPSGFVDLSLKKLNCLNVQSNENHFPPDIFQYMNLMLYTFPIDEKSSKELTSQPDQRNMIEEIYMSFSQIFTKEECKRALIRNNWNIVSTAMYLVENQNEIRQPLLIAERSILLFQTKIESTVSKTGRIEFRIAKNAIFDTTQYDYLKWSVTSDYVIGYKLKEGACILFSRNESDIKEFKYTYQEKVTIPAASTYLSGLAGVTGVNESLVTEQKKKIEEHLKEFEKIKEKKQGGEPGSEVFNAYMKKAMLKLGDATHSKKPDVENSPEDSHKDEPLQEKRSGKIKKDKKKTEELIKRINQLRKPVEKIHPVNPPSETTTEERTVEDTIKGTFIKTLNSIHLNKYEYIFCLDSVRKVYYILTNANLSSLNILVSDTFQAQAELSRKLISDDPLDFFETIAHSDGNIINYDYGIVHQKFIQLLLVIHFKKADVFWKYSNWSFYLNHLIEQMNLKSKEMGLEGSFGHEYSYTLLPYSTGSPNVAMHKILMHRSDKMAEKNEETLKEQLPQDIVTGYKIEEVPSAKSEALKRKYSASSAATDFSKWGNWVNENSLMFVGNTDEESKSKFEGYRSVVMYMENKREFFLSIDGSENSFDLLVKEVKECVGSNSNSNSLKYSLMLIYLWMINANYASLLLNNPERIDIKMKEFQTILIHLLEISDGSTKRSIYQIILSGWEILCRDFESQLYWFYYFYSLPGLNLNINLNPNIELNILKIANDEQLHPFNILMQKLTISNSINLLNNFHQVNLIKSYHLSTVTDKDEVKFIAKNILSSSTGKNFCFPFHWILLGTSLMNNSKLALSSKSLIVRNEISCEDDNKGFRLRADSKASAVSMSSQIEKIPFKKVLHEFKISSSMSESENDEFLRIKSEEFWRFLETDMIARKDSEGLIQLLIDMHSSCVGDLNEMISCNSEESFFSKAISIPQVALSKSEYYQKYFQFLGQSFLLVRRLVSNATEVEKSSTVNSILSYSKCVFYSICAKIKQSTIQNLEHLQEKIVDLMNEILKLKQLKPLLCYIDDIQLLSSTANQVEREISFDYNLGSEMLQISECVKFPGSSIITVEIELKSNKDKHANYDITIVSDEHPFTNLKYNTNNHNNKVGTCFQMKLNTNLNTKVYLLGEEVKIISPSELDSGKSSIGRNPKYVPSGKISSKPCGGGKSNLKIRCYPYNSLLYSFSPTANPTYETIRYLEFLKELDYFNILVNKSLIRSFDISPSEYENSLFKEPILKLGLGNNEKISMEFSEYEKDFPFSFGNYHMTPFETKVVASKCGNIFRDCLENLSYFPKEIMTEVQMLLASLIDSHSQENTTVLFNSNTSILAKIHNKIRETVFEPITYLNVKMFSSFNQQMRKMWTILEFTFILCLSYHLNLLEDLHSVFDPKSVFRIQPFLDLIGKKLNYLLSWMSGRVKIMKDTFDSTRNYLTELIQMNNDYSRNLKITIIEKIIHEHEATKAEGKDIKEQANCSETTPKKEKKEHKGKEAQLSKLQAKTQNFKKKANVKRLYNDLPKKKKHDAPSKKQTEIICASTQTEIEIPTYEMLINKDFDTLMNEYPIALEDYSNGVEVYKKMKENFRQKVDNDIKDAYFGDSEKLKNICEINNIPFNDSNPQESLKNYSNFIHNSIAKYFNADASQRFILVNTDEILNKLYSDSPYYTMAYFILERLFFLLQLKTLRDAEIQVPVDIPTLGRELSIKKSMSKKEEEDFLLTQPQQIIIRSMMNFLLKSSNVSISSIKSLMEKHFVRGRIRGIGLLHLSSFVSLKGQSYLTILSRIFLNRSGSICNSVRSDLKTGIENSMQMNMIKDSDILLILNYLMESFNSLIGKEEIMTFKLGKEVKIVNQKGLHDSISYENVLSFRLKNLNLILSDINILLKFVQESKSHANSNNILQSKVFHEFIEYANKLIFLGIESHNANTHITRLKTELMDNLRLILAKLVGMNNQNPIENKTIPDIVIDNLYEILGYAIQHDKNDLITNILDVIYYIAPHFSTEGSGHATLIKVIHKLFELLLKSETYETVSLACKICNMLLKVFGHSSNMSTDVNSNFFDSIYEKLGRLLLFKNINIDTYTFPNQSNRKFFVIVQMNSPEIDYQFLINALYYWENKYPTRLSLYNYKEFQDIFKVKEKDKEKTLQDILEHIGISGNPNLSVNLNINNTGQKVKMFNYFNPLKSKVTKMNLLEKIADERIANLKRAIDEGTKLLNSLTNFQGDEGKTLGHGKEEPASHANIESLKERIHKLRQQESYQNRVKAHIKIAEQIGETACTRGFVCIEPALSKELAEELAETIHKAYNRLLPHFKANIDETHKLFSDDLIYPKMPDKDLLLPGCTHTLKETTKSFMNVTLIQESAYERLENSLKQFTDSAKKIAQNMNQQEEKKTKIGVYNNNFLLGYNYATISSINFNDPNIKKVIDNNCVSGISITMIIDAIINMLYNTFDSQAKSSELVTAIKENFKKINKHDWNTCSSGMSSCDDFKMKLIGFLIVISGFYKMLRHNCKAIFNKNPEDVCIILNGGHKSGKNHSHVIFLKEKIAKIDKVNIKDLEKLKLNLNVVKTISFKSIIEAIINAHDIFLENKDCMQNKLLLHLLLKILNEKKIDQDEVIYLLENEREIEFRPKFERFVEILRAISNETLWLEKEDTFWETEFIDSFERIYNRIDVNSDLIYSPVFHFNSSLHNEILPLRPIRGEVDLITKYQLPESNYVRQLPKITDFSKCTIALKNIQSFDRYVVGEIFNYCQKQYRDEDYINSLYQIRFYLSNGDVVNARADINTIFDNNKTPASMPLPREYYDPKEIAKEDCYPGNFYLAKLSNKLIRESRIQSLIKQGGIGINEVPVLLLLQDNTINQALVLYNDDEFGKIYTFWVPSDNLMFLENQIKIPSNSLKLSELVNEYKYLEKRLRNLYAKNSLTNIMHCLVYRKKIRTFDDLLHYLILSNWQTYKLNPSSGIFHNFKNYISVKPNNTADISAATSVLSQNATRVTNLDGIIVNSLKEDTECNNIAMTAKKGDMGIEQVLSGLLVDGVPTTEPLIKWCMEKWDKIDENLLRFKTNLFTEYMVNSNESLRSKNMFHIGNFSNKLLALHELIDTEHFQYSAMVLSFEKEASLGPHAKLSFYSDPYGENVIHEIISIKTQTANLESCVFNHPKVWMGYTPGTRAFYIEDWFMQTRDSNLPCSLALIPYDWSPLIQLTDYCTSSLFVDVTPLSLPVFEKIIKKLLIHCTNITLPADVQRRIFNLTNRAILKSSKYLSLLEQQRLIKFSELSISQKFHMIGIDEIAVTLLINKINTFNPSPGTEKIFSSAYVVEGVEIILSILSVIKESFNSFDMYLRDSFNYSLPIWIEAVIKLGQFLNFLQGTSPLEGNLMKEVVDQLQISNQMEKVIVIQNVPMQIQDNVIVDELKTLLLLNNAKIVDVDKDVLVFTENEDAQTKTVCMLIDGFIIENLLKPDEEEEEKKEEPVEDNLWQCFYCKNENDKDNTFCVFCEKDKKPIPKEPPKKKIQKSSLVKNSSLNFTINEKIQSLKNSIKNSLVLSQYETTTEESHNDEAESNNVKIVTEKASLNFFQGEELKSKSSVPEIFHCLNKFFKLRLIEYIKEGDYIKDKIRNLERNPTLAMQISNELDIITRLTENVGDTSSSSINYLKLYETLQTFGIDFWLENVIVDTQSRNMEINIKLMEKIRELVDLKVCKEKNVSLIFPAVNLRFVPPNFNSINHLSLDSLENYYKDMREIPLCIVRYYWTIIKYFNNCLVAALPFIKPPDYYSKTQIPIYIEEGYVNIPFPKTISAFLSTSRGITFSFTKSKLIKEVIASTEFNEEEVQIPTFKFERLSIVNSLEKKVSSKVKKHQLPINLGASPDKDIYLNSMLYPNKTNEIDEEADMKEEREQEELRNEDSMFLQAFEQAKDVDPAFFRSKKLPGDPHVGFKVEFKGELVQGIGGPYRQFFSDISLELQSREAGNKKSLKLLCPTSNNIAQKGEFKDRFTITPSYNSNTALNYYEFLGILMGICIRTGVHLTLDLCSIFWKKIIDESITAEDIFQFDEGLYNQIIMLSDPNLTEEAFELAFNQNFVIELTDNTVHELIPDGGNMKIEFTDRYNFIRLALKARLCESDVQIQMIRTGLCKAIPQSLLKLLTYKELERLVCGIKSVDIELLKANTNLSQDLTESTPKVKWLWEILHELSDEDKIKFVKFCWAQERLPSTHEEFQKLQVKFTIKSYLDKNKKDIFPRADTCFFSLELPEYSSKEIMKKKIVQAINLDNVGMNADKISPEANINNRMDFSNFRGAQFYNEEDEDIF